MAGGVGWDGDTSITAGNKSSRAWLIISLTEYVEDYRNVEILGSSWGSYRTSGQEQSPDGSEMSLITVNKTRRALGIGTCCV